MQNEFMPKKLVENAKVNLSSYAGMLV